MKRLLLLLAVAAIFFSCSESPKVIIYSTPALQNTEAAQALTGDLMRQFEEEKTEAVLADSSSFIAEDQLKDINSLVFLNLDPRALDYRQQNVLERYVQAGGGLVVLGLAEDTLSQRYSWPWYHRLVQQIQQEQKGGAVATTAAAPLSLQYDGGTVRYWPLDFEAAELSVNSSALNQSIMEVADRSKPDFSKATSLPVPDANRFVTVALDNDLNEPMQMTILPDMRVLLIEREGLVKLYKPDEQKTSVIGKFNVSTEGNYEDGLLGVTADPAFASNGWVYFYYSPQGGEPKQNLSRFKMVGDSLLMQSEKVVLEVPVQRETCCHSAGGLEWGPDGYLYISTGDNTSSKESSGFTPIDERPGRGPFDAQKSSGNTNDLRGKLLRIKVEPDGSYSIPEGNLFPKGTADTKPEIYIMGVRNPFRFTVDPQTGFVYWGDVGPDGGQPGPQGPQSYDEWNQARNAGNFGWPYFVADNKGYTNWDFTTDTPGAYFDPQKPVNESPNNTGRKALPPAQGALIWYPYGLSELFPMLGTGSRSAMGGPFYHSRLYGDSETKFPAYYDGKWFIYEWARSWVQVVSFDEEHNLEKIEPFMVGEEFVKPIDMRFGPDGALYMLEYGANYFANNDEARLVKIEYAEGNRAPIARLSANKKVGAAPLTVSFSAAESFDYDPDKSLSYAWYFEDEKTVASTEPAVDFTFRKPGIYQVVLKVSDSDGKSNSASLPISVGNEPPVVQIETKGNKSFFFDGGSLAYNIAVKDKEDGSLAGGGVEESNLLVNYSYLKQGKDLALLGPDGGAGAADFLLGKRLIEGSDCRSCHDLSKASVGPTYSEIAQRYKGDYSAVEFLAQKIIAGGGGTWGDRLMAAHPQHSKEETVEMTKYILSLADEKPVKPRMPIDGKLAFDQHKGQGEEGSYVFSVAYRDNGANGIAPITSRETLVLRHPRVQAENYDDFRNVQQQRPQGGSLSFVSNIREGSYIMFKELDLTNINQLTYQVGGQAGGTIEVHLDAPDGPLLSSAMVPAGERGSRGFTEVKAPVEAASGVHDVYFVFKGENREADLMNLDWIYFHVGKAAL